MRTVRPPAEEVERAKPPKPIAADDGGILSIEMPALSPPRSNGDRADGGRER